ncbi:ABC transporter ATP-binding protein [Cryptosporangium arvum]|uniref:Fatty acid ABC transporter ATP-binding/permease protein n=1 Tax=Cryptosporangium arvum DSM 44712 TaxID=927661 RepID=A0A010Z411_9ACTN|nr:ABC transporter ATP-binding protein [Cryptosporangium arvum]EXG82128.1 ABC-type multidrug transport system, ATPase and permease component [Cryptosporangium arvum DSM 44712]
MSPARRLLRMLRPFRPAVLVIITFGLLSAVLNLVGPLLMGRATDLVVAGYLSRGLPSGTTSAEAIAALRAQNRDSLAAVLSTVDFAPGAGIDLAAVGRLLGLTLVLMVAASVLTAVRDRLTARIVQRVAAGLRRDVARKLTRLPLSYFDGHPRGELLSRVTNDVDNFQQVVQQGVGQLIGAAFSIVAVIAVMFALSPLLAVLVLAGTPLSIAVMTLISKRSQPRFDAQWAATGALNAHIEDIYSGHALVVGYDRRDLAAEAFDRHNDAMRLAGARARFLSGTLEPVMTFAGNLNYVLVAVVGALRVASGSLSIGSVQAFIQFAWQFNQPVGQLAAIAAQLQSGLASAARVFELLDTPEQSPDPWPPVVPGPTVGRVEFDRIAFRYSPDTPLIESLSLVARPGQTVAIVGPTGAGKTTLGNLLMRFYEPTAGRVLLDGTDIRDLTRDDLRSRIGLVSQDVWLTRGTVAENIAFGRPDASRADVVTAAEATCVDQFVRGLPDGYDTRLDDEHTTLSAGEKQLVTVARAYLARPAILILDEATSSVDTRTEVLIQRALRSLRAGRTTFVVAHRLSTIRDADVIVVMDAGRIVEIGAHNELVAAGGRYARLYATGTAAPLEEDGGADER